jgi:hypothetical protein
MWRFILCHSFYQFVVLAIFLFAGAGDPITPGGLFNIFSGVDADFEVDGEHVVCIDAFVACGEMTAETKEEYIASGKHCPSEQQCSAHFAMIFTTFVLMQLFNQFNSRKLGSDEWNIFVGLFGNMLFIYITLGEFGAQVLISQFGGAVFKVTGGLTMEQWAICFAFGAGHIPFHLIVCCVPPSLFNCLMGDDKPAAVVVPQPDVEAGNGLTRSRSRTTTFGHVDVEIEKPEDYKNKVTNLRTTSRANAGTNGFVKLKKTQSKFGASVDAEDQMKGSLRRLSSGIPSLK